MGRRKTNRTNQRKDDGDAFNQYLNVKKPLVGRRKGLNRCHLGLDKIPKSGDWALDLSWRKKRKGGEIVTRLQPAKERLEVTKA